MDVKSLVDENRYFVYLDEAPWTVVGIYPTLDEALDECIGRNRNKEGDETLYWVASRRDYYERCMKLRPPEDVVT